MNSGGDSDARGDDRGGNGDMCITQHKCKIYINTITIPYTMHHTSHKCRI